MASHAGPTRTICGEKCTIDAKYFDVVQAILHNPIGEGNLDFWTWHASYHTMKIVCTQFCPQFGKVQENADHVKKLVSEISPDQVDLLVLPEMALTGLYYMALTLQAMFLSRSMRSSRSWRTLMK